jgi:secretion/DNA translocation related TadE-like protein
MIRRGGCRDARGNVSVLIAAVVVVGLLLCTTVARLGGAAVERSRANNAADASALAAADRLALGQSVSEGCAVARRTATDNGARLLTCRSDAGSSPSLAVEVTLELGAAHARSRAEVDATKLDPS